MFKKHINILFGMVIVIDYINQSEYAIVPKVNHHHPTPISFHAGKREKEKPDRKPRGSSLSCESKSVCLQ